MAATTITQNIRTSSHVPSTAEIREAFAAQKLELMWLSEFLSNDELMASICLSDARNMLEKNHKDQIRQRYLPMWIREATFRSVVDFNQMRIAELSPMYEASESGCRKHLVLAAETLEFLIKESDVIRRRLDFVCRFVLIVCGVQQRSIADAAQLLGVSEHVVKAACGSALQALEIMSCQAFVQCFGSAAA